MRKSLGFSNTFFKLTFFPRTHMYYSGMQTLHLTAFSDLEHILAISSRACRARSRPLQFISEWHEGNGWVWAQQEMTGTGFTLSLSLSFIRSHGSYINPLMGWWNLIDRRQVVIFEWKTAKKEATEHKTWKCTHKNWETRMNPKAYQIRLALKHVTAGVSNTHYDNTHTQSSLLVRSFFWVFETIL